MVGETVVVHCGKQEPATAKVIGMYGLEHYIVAYFEEIDGKQVDVVHRTCCEVEER